MIWLFLLLVSCSEPAYEDPCDDWNWLDHESCSGDICGEYEGSEYECRHGECWCCLENECWKE